jgi:hypothetical protein
MKRIKIFTENTEKQMQDALDKWIDEFKPNIDKVTCSIAYGVGADDYPTLMFSVSYWR